jgi:hypothetical protein
MPRAHDPAILNRALGERRTLMRALILQRRKLSLNPRNADGRALRLKRLRPAFNRHL